MKKCILVLICIIVCIFSSCTAYENVTFIDHNNKQCLLYRGKKYYPTSIFTDSVYYMPPDMNDIELGWYYSFPFSTYFYSDTVEGPMYIYTHGGDTNVYLQQDYSYKDEVFIIAETATVITFAEAIIEPCFIYDSTLIQPNNKVTIDIYSERHTNLQTSLTLVSDSNNWYLILPTNEAYLVSLSFLDVLKESGIIGNKS